eukprot:6213127-Pleurochrysis_carterae.AAC.3
MGATGYCSNYVLLKIASGSSPMGLEQYTLRNKLKGCPSPRPDQMRQVGSYVHVASVATDVERPGFI